MQSVFHPSFMRFARYYILFFTRRVVPANRIGDQNSSSGTEMFVPVSKETPPETTTSEEISKVIFQTWKS